MFTTIPGVAGQRQIHSAPREQACASPEYHIVACDTDHVRRTEAESFVRRRYLTSHGARIATFMPTLLLLTSADNELVAVSGFRCAAQAPLFLERYLGMPIEQALSSHLRAQVQRSGIIEVGNFAAVDTRRARILMSFMPAFFLERLAQWIVFTATTSIRTLLCAMGGHCIEVGAANGACVAGGADEWGRYYSRDPRVMAGFLPSARRIPALWRSQHGD